MNPYETPTAWVDEHGPHNCRMCWWEQNWWWAVPLLPFTFVWLYVIVDSFYWYMDRWLHRSEQFPPPEQARALTRETHSG